jgi:Domain of Unknown Function with PDB structure (DUF3857)/Transglutaminase-like superfamily
MRICKFAFSFALVLSMLVSPLLLRAQFQQPTDEELKMTSDPKAPGAAAVYLYREETTDDALHYHSYYERIKVLTEKGKEQATIRIPYEHGAFKVTDVQGRTIHADGTVIPLTVKPSDLVDVKTAGMQFNTMVFTLPSAEMGSILEYRLQLRYDDNMVSSPTWHIQQAFYVHKAHYMFKPANTGGWNIISDSEGHIANQLMSATTGLTSDKVVRSIDGRFTVDLTDIPATPNEDWMPPLNTINKRVEFYYSYARSGSDYWASEGKRWAKETERFTNPGSELRKTAAELVAATDSDEQKARKIYTAVMKLDNTDFSRKKSDAERKAAKMKAIKNAEDVWAQKGGSSDEIAMLYVALARAAGLKVWPMQVVDRDRAIFDANYLNAGQLDDYIVILDLGGKEVFLDPGEKLCAFGVLHWKHTLASGIRLSDKGTMIATAPPNTFTTAVVKRIADLEIGADGSVKGLARVAMSGPDALRWRQLSLENDEDEVKKQFNEYMQGMLPDGAQAEFDHFLGLDDYESNLMGIVKISGSIGTATGKHFFLPGLFFESQAKHPFVAVDKRTTPIDVQYARYAVDQVSYHLPAGFSVESMPQTSDAAWPDHAMMKIGSKADGNSVVVSRSLVYNFTILPPTDYPSLHDFYQKVATADQQQLVLTRAAVAGN